MTRGGYHSRRAVIAAPLLAIGAASARSIGHSQDWGVIAQAARAEGAVTIYSTLPQLLWPVLSDAFAAINPGISIRPIRIDSIAGVFQRYASETAVQAETADLLIASSTDDWAPLSAAGRLRIFQPRGLEALPRWTFAPDRYTLSIEPQSFICRQSTPNPTGLHNLAKLVVDPSWSGSIIASYDPFASPFGFSVFQTLARHGGERFWADLAALAPHLRLGTAAPAMIGRIVSGQYRLGIYLPETFVPAGSATLAVVRPDDGLPVFPRTVAIPKEAPHPNAAKLLVDFLLSPSGQAVLAEHGVMAYRPGVARLTGHETFETLATRRPPPIPVVGGTYPEGARAVFAERLKHVLTAAKSLEEG